MIDTMTVQEIDTDELQGVEGGANNTGQHGPLMADDSNAWFVWYQ